MRVRRRGLPPFARLVTVSLLAAPLAAGFVSRGAAPPRPRREWLPPLAAAEPPAVSPHLASPPSGLAPPSGSVERGLLAAAATPFLMHDAPLPLLTRRLVSPRARVILAFVLEYLASDAQLATVEVYASGGYVRDLLLG